MGLLDDAREESTREYPQCSVALLPDDVRAEVEDALAAVDGRSVTGEGVARALAKRAKDQDRPELAVKSSTLNRHKRGGCSCGSS